MLQRYNISKLARAKGRRRAAKWKPRLPPPVMQRRLFMIANKVVRFWTKVIVEELLPAYNSAVQANQWRDAASDEILRSILRAAEDRASRLVASLNEEIEGWAVSVEEWEREDFARGLRTSVGVDTKPFLNAEDAAPEIAAYVEKNVALIKGLEADTAKRVERATWDAFIKQTPRRELAAELSEQMGIERRHAEFIARDQTTKLGNDLNQLRQEQAGITQYIWRHSGKVNYREDHKDRDGQVFNWDDPPEDGHPGEAPNCGCTAEAYIEV